MQRSESGVHRSKLHFYGFIIDAAFRAGGTLLCQLNVDTVSGRRTSNKRAICIANSLPENMDGTRRTNTN